MVVILMNDYGVLEKGDEETQHPPSEEVFVFVDTRHFFISSTHDANFS